MWLIEVIILLGAAQVAADNVQEIIPLCHPHGHTGIFIGIGINKWKEQTQKIYKSSKREKVQISAFADRHLFFPNIVHPPLSNIIYSPVALRPE